MTATIVYDKSVYDVNSVGDEGRYKFTVQEDSVEESGDDSSADEADEDEEADEDDGEMEDEEPSDM